jgi:protein-L-isoaspartate(D-aspartate) O-methyltransferase
MNMKQSKQELIREIRNQGIEDESVLAAMEEVPREDFVPKKFKSMAYLNRPLPIGDNQTISQPYIVALLCELLELDQNDKILDIGTGSGYQAAVLSRIVDKVISIERIDRLAEEADDRLNKIGYENIEVVIGNGTNGYEPEAPYSGIVSAAAADKIPETWKDQLEVDGFIVSPVDTEDVFAQKLVRLKKTNTGFEKDYHGGVRFVPLISD